MPAPEADTEWRPDPGRGRGPGRLISDLRPATGPANMALDAALFRSVQAGGPPVLRLYRWDPPTLSFGRNQPAAGLYDEGAAAARGIAFVRRPTGGQAVLHDDELTYAVAAPVSAIGRPRAAYAAINRALVAGLRALGVEASLAGPENRVAGRALARARQATPVDAPAPAPGSSHDWSAACFRAPARGEVVVEGRKLVGSAQRAEGRVILQHGSILVGGSQGAAEELLAEGKTGDVAGWTTLEAEVGRRPDWGALADAVAAGFRSVLGISLAPDEPTPEERETARRLEERFTSREWTWRR